MFDNFPMSDTIVCHGDGESAHRTYHNVDIAYENWLKCVSQERYEAINHSHSAWLTHEDRSTCYARTDGKGNSTYHYNLPPSCH